MDAQLQGLYELLLSSDYRGTPLWKRVVDKELTCVPHFVGTEYSKSDTKLMVVGRAVNGWETDYSGCDSAKSLASAVLEHENPLEDVGEGKNEHTGNYSYHRSRFWKLIHALLIQYGEAHPTTWECDEGFHWNQRILWTNLYKVSPWKAGNPEWAMFKPFMSIYIEIIKRELDLYSPKYALFVTDLNYFDPWKRHPSFARDLLGDSWKRENGENIVGRGHYLDTKVLVCKRPDRWGFSDADIENMAREIKKEFD